MSIEVGLPDDPPTVRSVASIEPPFIMMSPPSPMAKADSVPWVTVMVPKFKIAPELVSEASVPPLVMLSTV
jgi:hypothetical protein